MKTISPFKHDQVFAVVDYETFSECNLKKSGPWVYSKHPTTEVLVVSVMVGTFKELQKKIKQKKVDFSWCPKAPWNKHRTDLHKNKMKFIQIMTNPNIVKVAHNAMFEQSITQNVLPKYFPKTLSNKSVESFFVPHEQWFDTAVQAAIHAMPRSLDGVTSALKLNHMKDKEGHSLMLKWTKPKKPSKKDPSLRYVKNFDRLVQYCEHDIFAEAEVLMTLPMIDKAQYDLWLFDQEINFRGIKIDVPLVKKILKLIAEEKKNLTKELKQLTNGEVETGGQGAKIQDWLKRQKFPLPNLRAKTVSDAIKDPKCPPKVKRLLQVRQDLNKTSLRKYTAFTTFTDELGMLRCSLNFNATVHGRWGGQGAQPHNIPRGTLKVKDEFGNETDLAPFAAEIIKNGASLSEIRMLFDDPMEVFVSCLRTMIVADEGEELFVSDFSAIEARVLFWLAGHTEGIKAFKEKRKMYEELAMVIFNRKMIAAVLKDERFVGKQAFLLSGYGGGWKKFQSTCEQFGQIVSDEVSKKAIDGYRKLHSPVPKLWKNLEAAAIKAVENPGKVFKINKVAYFMEGKFLVCLLPSGRKIFYYGPEVRYTKTPWGDKKPVLYHWMLDDKKRWVFAKTWGGILTQNAVGGTSRDLLASAMWRAKAKKYNVRLTVHDENIASNKVGKGSIEEFNQIMKTLPDWANGCPVDVEGFATKRYRK